MYTPKQQEKLSEIYEQAQINQAKKIIKFFLETTQENQLELCRDLLRYDEEYESEVLRNFGPSDERDEEITNRTVEEGLEWYKWNHEK